jgi:low affinity Fe/Cu permease
MESAPPEYEPQPAVKLDELFRSKLRAASQEFVNLRKLEMERHAKELQRIEQAQRVAERDMEQAMIAALRTCDVKKASWFW